jgi:DNA (cytosine-5)-methyltransferase 1
MSKNRLNTLDLFAGAGGFSLGFSKAGFNIIGAIELNKKYADTHDLNFKGSKTIAGDIREWTPKKFSEITGIRPQDVDVIIGGPPCQTFSSIGGAKINSVTENGIKEDPRNYLYQDFYDFVRYFKPKVFIMENVPTMKTKYKGQLFENLLAKIDDIKYHAHYDILNSVNYGVPQIRKRLFVVGFKSKSNKFQFPEKTHYSPNEVEDKKSLLKYLTVKDAISDLPIIFDGIREHHLPYSKKGNNSKFKKAIRNGSATVGNNICRMSNERAKKVFTHMKQGDIYMDLAPEIRKILPFREDIFRDRLKRLSNNKPSWTVLAHIGMDGYMYIHPTETRTLSVREAARIQSFDDNFEFVGNMREQYIQVGNSVPPLLANAIAKSLKKHL